MEIMSIIDDSARNGFSLAHTDEPLMMKYDFTNHNRLHSDQLRLKLNSKMKDIISDARENCGASDYKDTKSTSPSASPPVRISSQEIFQENSVLDLHGGYPRPRMSMMSEQMATEPSKLLREMLQNKENNIQEDFSQNNNAKAVVCSNENDQGDSGCNTQDNGTDSDHSEHTEDLSGDESDVDSAYDRMMNEEDFASPKYSSNDNQKRTMSPDDNSKEAKRARVENIITSMRTVPNKRKQYQPQQHDMRFGDHFEGRSRDMERESLREQLAQLQHQLTAVQQKYVSLYDKENHSSSTSVETIANNNTPKKLEQKSVNGKLLSDRDIQILNRSDSEKMAKDTAKLIERNFDLEVRSPEDIEKIQKSLKMELANVVNNTVDSIFDKVVVRKLELTPKPVPKVETPKNVGHIEEIFKPRPIPPNTSPKEKHFEETFPFLRIPDSAFKTPEGRLHELHRPPHHSLFHMPFPYYPPTQVLPPPLYSCATEPEQTEAIPLVVNNQKKKRTKVTDTRISNRAARELISRDLSMLSHNENDGTSNSYSSMLLPNLPTSVAIPNPSLRNSDIMSFYSSRDHGGFMERSTNQSPIHGEHRSPDTACHSPSDGLQMFDTCSSHGYDGQHLQIKSQYLFLNENHTSTLTPMHLRKAKLMFFYLRYPSSAILKAYFPDVKFNKNNTAQLVKWFSNFREFFYIQMEKYARQAVAEQTNHTDELTISTDSEIYRVLNLHYNRNNQIEVPDTFRAVIQSTLREFYKAVTTAKDNEPSWKKSIYKVIARMDDVLPEFFKSANWMDQLNDL